MLKPVKIDANKGNRYLKGSRYITIGREIERTLSIQVHKAVSIPVWDVAWEQAPVSNPIYWKVSRAVTEPLLVDLLNKLKLKEFYFNNQRIVIQ